MNIISSTPNDGIETIKLTYDISFPWAPRGEVQQLIIGESYRIKVSSLSGAIVAYSGAKILEPWYELIRPRENEILIPENYKLKIKTHPEDQYLNYRIWLIVNTPEVNIRKLLHSPQMKFREHLSPLNNNEFLWDGKIPDEREVLSNGSTLGEWWKNYEGDFYFEIESWFRSVMGNDYSLDKIQRKAVKVKSIKSYSEGEGWATVSESDLSIENIRTYGRDVEIILKNHGPEPFYSRIIPLKVTISDRFATRVYHKEYSLTSSVSSVPVNGNMNISLGADLGICLQDQSFTVGVELKPQGYWRDNNSSNNVMGKHFNLTFDPRPNLYFSGTEKIRVTRRGDEVKVRTTIGYDGLPWCLSPHKVALRVLKQGGEIIYERETQATQGPVEFILSASEIKRLGGGKRSIIEVFLDRDNTINENNETDNHEYVYYDF